MITKCEGHMTRRKELGDVERKRRRTEQQRHAQAPAIDACVAPLPASAKNERKRDECERRDDVQHEHLGLRPDGIREIQTAQCHDRRHERVIHEAHAPREPGLVGAGREPRCDEDRVEHAMQRVPHQDEHRPATLQRADAPIAREVVQRRAVGLGERLGDHALIQNPVGES